ncbi:hypothetical protein [Niabella beijingensis]|uniref:hypothetical protein n=1 Tax=Niabella beijingensis TaxID=2872700 RepID=UPI001CBC4909|nr:hypothetical protein [Niabella beijingensis]MBZ4189263.1 hypothetical protein [Niabella beijingensis]
MKKTRTITIGIFILLIAFVSLTAFTRAEKTIAPTKNIHLRGAVQKSYDRNFRESKLNNLTRVVSDSDCSGTTWASLISMNIEYNQVTQYNNFNMNFTGSGTYILEYSIYENGPTFNFMGSGTIHNFSKSGNYLFPVALPPGDYVFDCIIKNECGEDVSDPMEFLFTNEAG